MGWLARQAQGRAEHAAACVGRPQGRPAMRAPVDTLDPGAAQGRATRHARAVRSVCCVIGRSAALARLAECQVDALATEPGVTTLGQRQHAVVGEAGWAAPDDHVAMGEAPASQSQGKQLLAGTATAQGGAETQQ